MSEPTPKVLMMIGNEKITSAAKPNTTNPKWNENHYFFLENPEDEYLICKIDDEASKNTLGSFRFAVKELLKEESMCIDRAFDINSLVPGFTPKLNIKLSLLVEFFVF